MSEMVLNRLKITSKSNFYWGLFNSFVTLPFFLYGSAFILHHENKKQFDFSYYYWKFFTEPAVFALVFLVIVNTIVDFWVYKNHQKIILKKCLLVLNLAYMLFILIRDRINDTSDDTISVILFALLLYKLFRYYQYWRLKIQHG